MFLFRLASFVFGYVNMLVQGENIEKFLNVAVSRGIYLWDISRAGDNRIFVKTRLSAVKPLRHIARKTKSRFSFRGRKGLPFIAGQFRRRKSLLAGALIFMAGLYILSSFVWFIDVKGNRRLPPDMIMKTAAEAGLRVGSLRFGVDRQRVENIILERIPEVSYVGVTISGTRATIEIAEKIIIHKLQMKPAHVVAKKAGLVREVLVLVGNPTVKEGDIVVPGQILISGVVSAPDGQNSALPGGPAGGQLVPAPAAPPAYVHARGVVRARVWYEGYGEAPLVEEGTRATGSTASRVCIKIAGKEIILSGVQKIPFSMYTSERDVKKPPGWRNISIPVELITDKYTEIENYREERSRDEAAGIARRKALESARCGIAGEVMILREQSGEVVLKNPEGVIRFTATIETLEDIGVEKAIH